MLAHWIWLAARPGLSDRMKLAVIRRFADAEDAYFSEDYESVGELTRDAVKSLMDKDLRSAEAIVDACREKRIDILTYRDTMYPNGLKNIADPPLVLYYQGQLPEFDALPVISVVGTRNATAYGLSMAKRMGAQIARCGGLVVSGAAAGIDAMAMRGALSAGKPAVGVLGCGVDIVYPAINRSLLEDCRRFGCLISEYPPGTPPHKWNFPRRNRIISGLSCGVLVVEAPERSGALITANQAAEQGRDLYVIPGNVGVAACTGSNALLREGGIAVSTGWDILSEYEYRFPGKVCRDPYPGLQTVYPDEMKQLQQAESRPAKVAQKRGFFQKKKKDTQKDDKKPIDNGSNQPYIDLNEKTASLPPEQRAILEQLTDGEKLVDDVIAATGLSSGQVLSSLTLLELQGFLTRLPGRRICLKRQTS